MRARVWQCVHVCCVHVCASAPQHVLAQPWLLYVQMGPLLLCFSRWLVDVTLGLQKMSHIHPNMGSNQVGYDCQGNFPKGLNEFGNGGHCAETEEEEMGRNEEKRDSVGREVILT